MTSIWKYFKIFLLISRCLNENTSIETELIPIEIADIKAEVTPFYEEFKPGNLHLFHDYKVYNERRDCNGIALVCTAPDDQKLKECEFESPSGDEYLVDKNLNRDGLSCYCNETATNACGIKLHKIRSENVGTWRCVMKLTRLENGKTYRGYSKMILPSKRCHELGWQDWGSWSKCNCDGYKTRNRGCKTGEGRCDGKDSDRRRCNSEEFRGCWSSWRSWSPCTKACGGGVRSRTRSCRGGDRCPGENSQRQKCNTQKCSSWSSWSFWVPCTKTCGGGLTSRTRECQGGDRCPGDSSQRKRCKTKECPTWSSWSAWLPCTKTCGEGLESRKRTCHGGDRDGNGCPGDDTESKRCNKGSCSSWASWGPWTGCNRECGGGFRSRRRKCDGTDCGGDFSQGEQCNHRRCGKWSTWTAWTPCVKSGNEYSKKRTRTCSNGYCPGDGNETEICSAIHGGWGHWGSFGSCSGSIRFRFRSCNNPPPQNGGSTCSGSSSSSQGCRSWG